MYHLVARFGNHCQLLCFLYLPFFYFLDSKKEHKYLLSFTTFIGSLLRTELGYVLFNLKPQFQRYCFLPPAEFMVCRPKLFTIYNNKSSCITLHLQHPSYLYPPLIYKKTNHACIHHASQAPVNKQYIFAVIFVSQSLSEKRLT